MAHNIGWGKGLWEGDTCSAGYDPRGNCIADCPGDDNDPHHTILDYSCAFDPDFLGYLSLEQIQSLRSAQNVRQ